MAQVLLKASAYILVIVLGYVLKRLRFFKPDDYRLVLKITLNITLPAAVITNFASFDFDFSLLFAVLLSVGSNLLLWGLGYLFSAGKGRETRVLYTLNFPGYNIGTFALPFVQGFLGPVGVITTCLFDAGNAMLCTGGSYALTSRVAGGEGTEKLPFSQCLRKLFTTPFCTYLLMLLLSILRIPIPDCVLPLAKVIGGANGFMAMLMIGMMFEFNPDPSFLKQAATILAVRFAAAIGLSCLFYFALPFSLEVRQALCLLAFAPCSAMSPAFTEKLRGNTALSSFTGSLTILLSIVILIFLLTIMGLS